MSAVPGDKKEENVIICSSVSEGRAGITGAVQTNCSRCDAGVWLSPSGQEMLSTHSARPVCLRCAVELAKEDDGVEVPPLSKEQIEETKAHGVRDPELLHRLLKEVFLEMGGKIHERRDDPGPVDVGAKS